MDAARTFRHQGYDLLCGSKAIDNGKFAPTLIVCKAVWPTRPRIIAVDRGDHSTEQIAIDAAHTKGVEWILNYG
jgi:hypothetical protein